MLRYLLILAALLPGFASERGESRIDSVRIRETIRRAIQNSGQDTEPRIVALDRKSYIPLLYLERASPESESRPLEIGDHPPKLNLIEKGSLFRVTNLMPSGAPEADFYIWLEYLREMTVNGGPNLVLLEREPVDTRAMGKLFDKHRAVLGTAKVFKVRNAKKYGIPCLWKVSY